MHHQVRAGNARVDRLDAVDGQNVAGRLALELVGAVRGSDRDGERVTLGLVDEARCLVGIGQELVLDSLPSAPWRLRAHCGIFSSLRVGGSCRTWRAMADGAKRSRDDERPPAPLPRRRAASAARPSWP